MSAYIPSATELLTESLIEKYPFLDDVEGYAAKGSLYELLGAIGTIFGVKTESDKLGEGGSWPLAHGLYGTLIAESESFRHHREDWEQLAVGEDIDEGRLTEFKEAVNDCIPLTLRVPGHRFLAALLSLNGQKYFFVMNRGYLSTPGQCYVLYQINNTNALNVDLLDRLTMARLDKDFYARSFTKGKLTRGLFLTEYACFAIDKREQKNSNCINTACIHFLALLIAMAQFKSGATHEVSDFQSCFEAALIQTKLLRAQSVVSLLKVISDLIRDLLEHKAQLQELEACLVLLDGICKKMTIPDKSSELYKQGNVSLISSTVLMLKASALSSSIDKFYRENSLQFLFKLSRLDFSTNRSQIHQVFERKAFIGAAADEAVVPDDSVPRFDPLTKPLSLYEAVIENRTDSVNEHLSDLSSKSDEEKSEALEVLFESLADADPEVVAESELSPVFDYLVGELPSPGQFDLLNRAVELSVHQKNMPLFETALRELLKCKPDLKSWSTQFLRYVDFAFSTQNKKIIALIQKCFPEIAHSEKTFKTNHQETLWHIVLEQESVELYLGLTNHIPDECVNKWGDSQFLLACLSENIALIKVVIPHMGSASMARDHFGFHAVYYLLNAYEARRLSLVQMKSVVNALRLHFDAASPSCPAGQALLALMSNPELLRANLSVGLAVAKCFNSTDLVKRILILNQYSVCIYRDFPWLDFAVRNSVSGDTHLLRKLLGLKHGSTYAADLAQAHITAMTERKHDHVELLTAAMPDRVEVGDAWVNAKKRSRPGVTVTLIAPSLGESSPKRHFSTSPSVSAR